MDFMNAKPDSNDANSKGDIQVVADRCMRTYVFVSEVAGWGQSGRKDLGELMELGS